MYLGIKEQITTLNPIFHFLDQSSIQQIYQQRQSTRSSQQQNTGQQIFRQNNENQEKQRLKISKLEERISQVENIQQKNIQMMNKITLYSLDNFRKQIESKIKDVSQAMSSQLRKIESRQKNKQKSATQKKQKISELEKKQQNDEDEEKVKQFYKKMIEKSQQEKFQQLHSELRKKSMLGNENPEMVEERVLIQRKQERSLKGERYLEAVQEKILEKERAMMGEEIKNLNKKMNKLLEKNARQLQIKQLNINPESLVEISYASHFHIHHNCITRSGKADGYRMVMLNKEVDKLCLHIHIHQSSGGNIFVGVTDRVQQNKSQCADSEHSLVYWGWGRTIYYGDGNEEVRRDTGDRLCSGMDVVVEVDKSTSTITFTLEGDSTHAHNNTSIRGIRKYQVQSPILSQPKREFVPCLEIADISDCVSWQFR